MQRMATLPRVTINPDFVRFVGLQESYPVPEVSVWKGSSADRAPGSGTPWHRDGEFSVRFLKGPLGLTLVSTGDSSAPGAVSALKSNPDGSLGQAAASGIIRVGDAVTRVNGKSVAPCTYSQLVAQIKASRRPLILHFVHPANESNSEVAPDPARSDIVVESTTRNDVVSTVTATNEARNTTTHGSTSSSIATTTIAGSPSLMSASPPPVPSMSRVASGSGHGDKSPSSTSFSFVGMRHVRDSAHPGGPSIVRTGDAGALTGITLGGKEGGVIAISVPVACEMHALFVESGSGSGVLSATDAAAAFKATNLSAAQLRDVWRACCEGRKVSGVTMTRFFVGLSLISYVQAGGSANLRDLAKHSTAGSVTMPSFPTSAGEGDGEWV